MYLSVRADNIFLRLVYGRARMEGNCWDLLFFFVILSITITDLLLQGILKMVVEVTTVAILILPVSLPYSCSKTNGACPGDPSRGARPEKTTNAFVMTICGDV